MMDKIYALHEMVLTEKRFDCPQQIDATKKKMPAFCAAM
jgi:hypothetical protein